jgi:hypothetical protein
MFQLGFAETVQADREREIAELVRQRRLLEPDVDGTDPDKTADRAGEPRPQRVRPQASRG